MSLDIAKDTTNEKQVLMDRADKLGLSYSPNIGLETLRTRVNDAIQKNEEETNPKEKTRDQKITDAKNEAIKLVRVIVNPIDPLKTSLEGEIIAVANSYVEAKKYIHFGVPWHIPNIVYQHIKNVKYQQYFTKKNNKGEDVKKSRLVPAYSVELLDPLTKEELEELAKNQAARQSIAED